MIPIHIILIIVSFAIICAGFKIFFDDYRFIL